ncbi:DUF2953 domain-containing protein [Virgibacillus halophilus]|uniref:DUF2953 domain-containing protein n=1 Tax=Tigheibacillus halophilus TaxID=361280 RepID=A0ABU5CCD0_9BACI|nr:DUF2953 domain-containing protein [Virgibacillus halophilus]
MLLVFGIILVLISIIVLVFVLLSHVHIHIQYKYANLVFVWEITMRFYGMEIRHYEGSSESGEDEKYLAELIHNALNQSDFHSLFTEMKRKINKYYLLLNALLPKVRVRKLYWQTKFGTGDACSTGILAGVLWSMKGSAGAFIQEKCNVEKQPQIGISPYFQTRGLQSELDCIATIKMGKAIRMRKQFKQIMMQQQSG